MRNMGNCLPAHSQSSQSSELARSRSIDRQIRADEKRLKTEVKILLLGAGESGKSTVLKQMRMIYAREFSDEERRGYRAIVLTNVLSIMQILLEIMDNLDMHFEDPSLESYVRLFENVPINNDGPFPQEYLEPLKRLWRDPATQRACLKGNAFALHDNCDYFYEDLDRIWAPDYVPTDRDIIHCRAKSTGITETVFHLGPLTYRMFDLGGQRSERKKWIHCFDKVTSILFVVAMSGYDQCLIEDRDSNQMQEALMLFNNVCNSPWFTKTSIILFLNKIDIFQEKIKTSPIADYFPDYTGPPGDFEQGKNYFRKRFQRLNRNLDKRVYIHYTDATDTHLLRHVMNSVSEIILNENLSTLML